MQSAILKPTMSSKDLNASSKDLNAFARTTTGHPHKITINTHDGPREIVVPRCVADVENQDQYPAWLLALVALSRLMPNGRINWSPFARDSLRRLSEQYGDDEVRRQLIGLIVDMSEGFQPINPIGLLIHRVRKSGTTRPIDV